MAILIGALSAAGILCVAAFGYRRGHRAGYVQGARSSEQWRQVATSVLNARGDALDCARRLADDADRDLVAWKRRADAFGVALRQLGYTMLEIEDPATGQITYRPVMTQPATKLPLGPSMS